MYRSICIFVKRLELFLRVGKRRYTSDLYFILFYFLRLYLCTICIFTQIRLYLCSGIRVCALLCKVHVYVWYYMSIYLCVWQTNTRRLFRTVAGAANLKSGERRLLSSRQGFRVYLGPHIICSADFSPLKSRELRMPLARGREISFKNFNSSRSKLLH